jgi:hypothetical protein
MMRIICSIMFCGHLVMSQLIPIQSVPLATGNQFLIYPAKYFGMAGVSIALTDPYEAAFINPVSGRFIQGTTVFCLPTFYKSTDLAYFNKSFPIAILHKHSTWFSGLTLSLQELNTQLAGETFASSATQSKLSNSSRKNHYVHLFAGGQIINATTYLGGSFFWSDLNAIDGISYLYANSMEVDQEGTILDYRVGIAHEFDKKHSLEFMLLHNRFDMLHRVTYSGWWMWNDSRRDMFWPMDGIEENKDRTHVWGGHVRYLYPVAGTHWQLGSIFTLNYKNHPKIPNYDLMNIPRDPGNSWAYNIGFGIAKAADSLAFGIDFIYEPVWSNTWAEANSDTRSANGRIITMGDKTVINDFQFYNYHLRAGFSNENRVFGMQMGLAIYSVNYRLKQQDYLLERRRSVEESWFEWHFTWGLLLKFSSFNLQYQGMATHGLGRPGVDTGGIREFAYAGIKSDIILAPAGDLTLFETAIYTHRFTLSVPIGN